MHHVVTAMDQQQHKQFTRMFVTHQARIYGYVATLVPNRADAEEIFQETSMVLWEKWEEFDADRDFVRWACGIAHNVTRNFLRKQHRSRAYFDTEFVERVASARLDEHEYLDARRQALAECVSQLPERQRSLLERCYSGVETIRSVAEQLGLTANSLYLKLRRIRRIVFECVNRALTREDRA